MTAFTIIKAQADAVAAREEGQDRLAVLVKKGRKVTLGETAEIKVGKTVVLSGLVCATAVITFTPIALRRVLDIETAGAAGETAKNLLLAAEQGSPQAAEHLVKLAAVAGFARWAEAFSAEEKTAAVDDTALEMTRRVVVLTSVQAV